MLRYLKSANWLTFPYTPFRFFQTTVACQINDKFTNQNPSEEQVTIQTCGNLYKKWKAEKKFWKIPDSDLTFNVHYVDTGKHLKTFKDSPLVLALHGVPGTYKDFDRLTTFLTKHGIRVISPNFPDFNNYKPGVFRHSAEEKAQYVKDFLNVLNIKHLDLLICHSSAVFPGLKLCIENDAPTISGLAVLNPSPFRVSTRLRYWPLVKTLVYCSEFSLGLKILNSFGPLIKKFATLPVQYEDLYEPLLSATVLYHGNVEQSKESYRKLSESKFPILMVFSENDRLVDTESSYKIVYALGLQDSQIFRYNERGVLVNEGKVLDNTKVMAFEKGSHYSMIRYSEILNEEILKFCINIYYNITTV